MCICTKNNLEQLGAGQVATEPSKAFLKKGKLGNIFSFEVEFDRCSQISWCGERTDWIGAGFAGLDNFSSQFFVTHGFFNEPQFCVFNDLDIGFVAFLARSVDNRKHAQSSHDSTVYGSSRYIGEHHCAEEYLNEEDHLVDSSPEGAEVLFHVFIVVDIKSHVVAAHVLFPILLVVELDVVVEQGEGLYFRFCSALIVQQITVSFQISSIGDYSVASRFYWLFGRTSINRASSGLVYQNRTNAKEHGL